MGFSVVEFPMKKAYVMVLWCFAFTIRSENKVTVVQQAGKKIGRTAASGRTINSLLPAAWATVALKPAVGSVLIETSDVSQLGAPQRSIIALVRSHYYQHSSGTESSWETERERGREGERERERISCTSHHRTLFVHSALRYVFLSIWLASFSFCYALSISLLWFVYVFVPSLIF